MATNFIGVARVAERAPRAKKTNSAGSSGFISGWLTLNNFSRDSLWTVKQFIERRAGVSVTFIPSRNVVALQPVRSFFFVTVVPLSMYYNCPSFSRAYVRPLVPSLSLCLRPRYFFLLSLSVFLSFFFLFFFFLIFGNQSGRCGLSAVKLSKSIGRFRRPGPTSVSARNPLKYTGPFLLTPWARELKRDSFARLRAQRGGRGKMEDIVEWKTIRSNREILIKLRRYTFFRRVPSLSLSLSLCMRGFTERVSPCLGSPIRESRELCIRITVPRSSRCNFVCVQLDIFKGAGSFSCFFLFFRFSFSFVLGRDNSFSSWNNFRSVRSLGTSGTFHLWKRRMEIKSKRKINILLSRNCLTIYYTLYSKLQNRLQTYLLCEAISRLWNFQRKYLRVVRWCSFDREIIQISFVELNRTHHCVNANKEKRRNECIFSRLLRD